MHYLEMQTQLNRMATANKRQKSAGKPVPRQRRSTAEVRALILKAAGDLFVRQGYDRTSTRDIAQAAGIVEPMIFRHFGTKEQLFEASVFLPFSEFVDDYIAHWKKSDYASLSRHELARTYTQSLYGFLKRRRGLLRELLIVGFRTNWRFIRTDRPESPFGRFFQLLDEISRHNVATYQLRPADPGILLRLTLGTVISACLLEGWMYPDRKTRPTEQQIIHELSEFLEYATAPPGEDHHRKRAVKSARQLTERH